MTTKTLNTIRRIVFVVLAIVMYVASTRADAQGFSYITMGPNGETLVCTPLQGGGTFCVEQR